MGRSAGDRLPEDMFDITGKKLANDLRGMNERQRIFTEKLINDVVYYGKLGSLNEFCSVNVPRPQQYGQNYMPPPPQRDYTERFEADQANPTNGGAHPNVHENNDFSITELSPFLRFRPQP